MKTLLLKIGLVGGMMLGIVSFSFGQTFSPANDTQGVSISELPSITFSETIIYEPQDNIGTHYIKIYKYDGANWDEIEQFSITTFMGVKYSNSDNLTISDTEIILNPYNNFEFNSQYYISVPAALTNTDNFSGTNEDSWHFKTEAPLPAISTLSPADNSTSIPVDQNLTITFSEDIQLGSDIEELTIFDGSGTFQTYEVTNPSLTVTGNQLIIAHNNFSYSTDYHVLMDAGFVESSTTSEAFGGISDPADWNFTTEPEPLIISSTTPTDDATNVPIDTDLTMTFSEGISAGSGFIEIHKGTSSIISINISETSIVNNTLTLPSTEFSLDYATDYHIEIEPGVIQGFSGITDATTWNFTTETGPPAWITSPYLSNQLETTVEMRGETDQQGTLYYVVDAFSSNPSPQEVIDGNSTGTNFDIAGSFEISANSLFNEQIPIGSLNFPTEYQVYVLAVSTDGKYDEVIELDEVIDLNAPEYLSMTPANGFVIAPVETNISITFSERLYDEAGDPLTGSSVIDFIQLLGPNSTQVDFIATVSSNGRVITLNPEQDLAENTLYTISFDLLRDQYGNIQEEAIPNKSIETDGTFTWTGASQTNPTSWTDDNNWSGTGFVDKKSVIIPASASSFPVLTTGDDIRVNNLTIEPGAALTQNGGSLAVSGIFTLQSSTEKNASYLPFAGTLPSTIRVEQHISNTAESDNYFVASPVIGATRGSAGITDAIVYFDNPANSYLFLNNDGDILENGRGYVVRNPNDIVFEGTPQTGGASETVTIELFRTSKALGWNLVGNPFTASIDWSQLTFNDVEVSFWLWLNESGIYGTYNGSSGVGTVIDLEGNGGIIPSNHSFWVKVPINDEDGKGSLEIPRSAMTVNQDSYLKSTSTSTKFPSLKLKSEINEEKDELAIVLAPEASLSKDKYDTDKMLGNSNTAVEIYSIIDNQKLSINGFAFDQQQMEIPVGYQSTATGTCSFSLSMNTLSPDMSVILHDKYTNQYTQLSDGTSYEVDLTTSGAINDRFSLILSSSTVTSSGEMNSEIQKTWFHSNNSEIIAYIGPLKEPVFKLFDINGRLLNTGNLMPGSRNIIPVNQKGPVILIVDSPEKVLRFKTVF